MDNIVFISLVLKDIDVINIIMSQCWIQ